MVYEDEYIVGLCLWCTGISDSYPYRQSSSGSSSKRQFPSSATLFTGEPLRGTSATPSAFDQQDVTSGQPVSAYSGGRVNTHAAGHSVWSHYTFFVAFISICHRKTFELLIFFQDVYRSWKVMAVKI